jgi:DNA-binding response OmpR family regulator
VEKSATLRSKALTGASTNLPLRILVVDDDEAIRKLHAHALTRSGYETKTAEDGATAWEVLQLEEYHLLITDNNMPNVSGLELIKRVRFAQLPVAVILASGTPPRQELEQNTWVQPVATLVKPFSYRQLLAAVTEILAPLISPQPGWKQPSA